MAARDIFHNVVRVALEKDKWIITHDPLSIKVDDIDFYVDLGAEKVLAAQKDGQKIAVEVKSFVGASEVSEFHTALGQFLNYRSALRDTEPERVLFLAISLDIYDEFFTRKFIQKIITEYQVKLLVFNQLTEEIVLWKN